ncbi:receptor-like protein EIX2 [Cryptomeria japonica]|uniref:receptor-like protein EIX2 n=1 Tax=Cryptomeria japonica TaxID=3369 RepID=UPI0027DA1314|nr:receptor-like protein EIX2 [Cryptomeria japonica]
MGGSAEAWKQRGRLLYKTNDFHFHRILSLHSGFSMEAYKRALNTRQGLSIRNLVESVYRRKSNIPSNLGLLRGLISLNISKNNLSGLIPESLGAWTLLESLDLSENNLSGKIPIQLLNLTFPAVLNLSDNMLSGLIPQGKQFSTFEVSSFRGNPNLHGPPLENRTESPGFGRQYNYKELNNTSTESVDVDVMDRWWVVGVGLSYGVGFATMIAVLCFHMKWRYIYFSFMDNFIYDLFE